MVPCHIATSYCTRPYYDMQLCTISHHTMPLHTIPPHAGPYHTALPHKIQYHTTKYHKHKWKRAYQKYCRQFIIQLLLCITKLFMIRTHGSQGPHTELNAQLYNTRGLLTENWSLPDTIIAFAFIAQIICTALLVVNTVQLQSTQYGDETCLRVSEGIWSRDGQLVSESSSALNRITNTGTHKRITGAPRIKRTVPFEPTIPSLPVGLLLILLNFGAVWH